MNIDLRGHRALVTGASRGIGRAISISLAKAGADVGVGYAGDRAAAEACAAEIQDLGRRACIASADLIHENAAEELMARVQDCRTSGSCMSVRVDSQALSGIAASIHNQVETLPLAVIGLPGDFPEARLPGLRQLLCDYAHQISLQLKDVP